MKILLGNSCARGCMVYLTVLAAIVVVAGFGLSGLKGKFDLTSLNSRPEASALSISHDRLAPLPGIVGDVTAGGGGVLPTPESSPAPAPAPIASPQTQPQPPVQGQGGEISGETSPPFYIVQSGDTLWSIANRFGVDLQALRALNNLFGDLIVPGQLLYLPLPGQAQMAAGPTSLPASDSQAGEPSPGVPEMPHTGINKYK